FCPRIESTLKLGDPVHMQISVPGTSETNPVSESLVAFEPERLLSWEMRPTAENKDAARRDQYLEALGTARCRYVTTDIFLGVKRDIQLLARVNAGTGDEVTVLDVSLDSNREALLALLDAGARVRYFDHHHAGELPLHPGFEAHIDTAADVCTSLLVDRHLAGRHRAWAITAAFGDSLPKMATALARSNGFDADTTASLARLGIALNYNAYGERLSDLHFDPAALAEEMRPFDDPLRFAADSPVFRRLWSGYEDDMA